MKKVLILASVAAAALTACHHNPSWHYDCARNYSEDSATKAECEARVAQMNANRGGHHHNAYNQGGTIGLRADISGPRAAEEIGHATQDD